MQVSKSKFTSGPWKVGKGKLKRFSIHQDVGPSAGGRYIGTTTANHPERMPRSILEEDAANARLVADAPNMHELLLESMEFISDRMYQDDCAELRRKITELLNRHGG